MIQNEILKLERYDYQDMRSDNLFVKQMIDNQIDWQDETIVLSDKLQCMSDNSGELKQMQMVISTKRVYFLSIEKKIIKKVFTFSQLMGLSIGLSDMLKNKGLPLNPQFSNSSGSVKSPGSEISGKFTDYLLPDFVFHIEKQPDLRGKSSNGRHFQIVEALRYFYELNKTIEVHGPNSTNVELFTRDQSLRILHNDSELSLPIFGCFELKQYCRSKKDTDRGIIRMPGDQTRINLRLDPFPNFRLLLDYLKQRKLDAANSDLANQ